MASELDDSVMVYLGAFSLIVIAIVELVIGKAMPISLSGSVVEKVGNPVVFYLLSIGKFILGLLFLILMRSNKK